MLLVLVSGFALVASDWALSEPEVPAFEEGMLSKLEYDLRIATSSSIDVTDGCLWSCWRGGGGGGGGGELHKSLDWHETDVNLHSVTLDQVCRHAK